MKSKGEILICDKCHFSYDVTKPHVCKPKNVEIANASKVAALPTMPPGQVDFHLKSVAGRVLTLIDGAVPEGKQNAALKSLIKKEFREEFNRTFKYLYGGERCFTGMNEADIFDKD